MLRRRTDKLRTYDLIVSPDHLILSVLEVVVAQKAQLEFVGNLQPVGIYADSSVRIVSDEAIPWRCFARNKHSRQTAEAMARRCPMFRKGCRRHDDSSNCEPGGAIVDQPNESSIKRRLNIRIKFD
jgi:hypothetical protein